jgi:hypothetical protein
MHATAYARCLNIPKKIQCIFYEMNVCRKGPVNFKIAAIIKIVSAPGGA